MSFRRRDSCIFGFRVHRYFSNRFSIASYARDISNWKWTTFRQYMKYMRTDCQTRRFNECVFLVQTNMKQSTEKRTSCPRNAAYGPCTLCRGGGITRRLLRIPVFPMPLLPMKRWELVNSLRGIYDSVWLALLRSFAFTLSFLHYFSLSFGSTTIGAYLNVCSSISSRLFIDIWENDQEQKQAPEYWWKPYTDAGILHVQRFGFNRFSILKRSYMTYIEQDHQTMEDRYKAVLIFRYCHSIVPPDSAWGLLNQRVY